MSRRAELNALPRNRRLRVLRVVRHDEARRVDTHRGRDRLTPRGDSGSCL